MIENKQSLFVLVTKTKQQMLFVFENKCDTHDLVDLSHFFWWITHAF